MKEIAITNRTQEIADAEFNKLFDELVPSTGKADTKAGEIVRATARLQYRWFNDGDRVGIGYGRQTCNPACRFLMDKLEDYVIESGLVDMTIEPNCSDEVYEQCLLALVNFTIDFVAANPQLKEDANNENYLDWYDAEYDVDDTEEDYEEEEEW